MSAWLFAVVAVGMGVNYITGFITGFFVGEYRARVPKLPPRLNDPPEPKVDARDDWWRE